MRAQIATVVATADFNGKNLIQSAASNLNVLSTVDGSTITVTAQPLDTTTLLIHTAALDTATNAATAVSAVSQAIIEVSTALTSLGTASRRLEIQADFTTQLVDVLKESVGNLVDADLAQESASLQALQIKQQLGVQALSMAMGVNDVAVIRSMLQQLVPEYTPNGELVDWVHLEQEREAKAANA